MNFKDKVALVTGGSRGIGRAISIKLASLGAYVFINYASREDSARETLKMCLENGGAGEVIGFNVGNADEVATAFEKIKSI